MVARIRSGASLKGAVNYNEMKVKQGKAELIAVHLMREPVSCFLKIVELIQKKSFILF